MIPHQFFYVILLLDYPGIDLVEIPYHGQPACKEEEVCRGLAKGGTTHFHRYATLAIVHHHWR